MEIALAILGGAAGGLIVLLIEQGIISFREKRKEKRQRLISFPNSNREIDDSIFNSLSPGRSVELMKAVLGTPNKTYKDVDPAFPDPRYDGEGNEIEGFDTEEEREAYDKEHEANAYLYEFKNANVKVTSKDGVTINSLAVEIRDGKLKIPDLPLGWAYEDENGKETMLVLGESKVDKNLVESCNAEHIRSRWDDIFVLCLYTGAPFYTYYTYFGLPEYEDDVEVSKENPESFIGGTITGICLHSMQNESFVISSFDLL